MQVNETCSCIHDPEISVTQSICTDGCNNSLDTTFLHIQNNLRNVPTFSVGKFLFLTETE